MLQSFCIDVNYCGIKKFASMFLLKARNGEAAIIDTGTPHSFSSIKNFLKTQGVKEEQLTKIFLTHSHLDHSGNISLFTRHYPNVKIYLHPLTAKLMQNPALLIQRMKNTMKNYEREFSDEVKPIPERFLFPTYDNMTIKFGDSNIIKVINTPGHSIDHISYFDMSSKTLYSGDGMGQCYRDISPEVSVFACPPLSNPTCVPSVIQKIRKLNPIRFGLGHFGYVNDAKKHLDQCETFMKKYLEILKDSKNPKNTLESFYDKLFFPQCTEKDRRLKGHMRINYFGILYSRQPDEFLDPFKNLM